MGSSKLVVKRGKTPDETRPFAAHGHAEMSKIGDASVLRGVFEPGWKWSADVAPIAGTKSCQAPHLGYVLSGRMRIRTDDGAEDEVGPGDFFRVAPGHDAWVIGNEACVMVDFGGYEQYAKAEAGRERGEREAAGTTPRPPEARR
jgi:hypothetical protein